MRKIRKIINRDVVYDFEGEPMTDTDHLEQLTEAIGDLMEAVQRLAMVYRFDYSEATFLNSLISLDFKGVEEREIKEIMPVMESGKNTVLMKLKLWQRTGVVYRRERQDKADVYGVNYVEFAQLTGLEIICY